MTTITRPSVPDVVPLARAIYARSSTGCCLHIVLDDRNLADTHVDYSATLALARGHQDCLELAELLRRMTRSQRERVGRLAR